MISHLCRMLMDILPNFGLVRCFNSWSKYFNQKSYRASCSNLPQNIQVHLSNFFEHFVSNLTIVSDFWWMYLLLLLVHTSRELKGSQVQSFWIEYLCEKITDKNSLLILWIIFMGLQKVILPATYIIYSLTHGLGHFDPKVTSNFRKHQKNPTSHINK